MSNDTVYTLIGLVLIVVGAFVLWVVAKSIFGFLLDHWISTLVVLALLVGVGVYFLSKDGANGA